MSEDSKDSTKAISKASYSFLLGTLLSRFSGLSRDWSMAVCFGVTPLTAAFMAAFRFSNLLRRLLGEGTMHATFVPQYERLKKENEKSSIYFFRDLIITLCVTLIGIVLLIEGALYASTFVFNYSENDLEILHFSMLMWPGILFICLAAVNGSFLQCEGKFFLPSVAPVAFNIIWVAAVFLFTRFLNYEPKEAITGLSAAIVLAYGVHWLAMLPQVKKIITRRLHGEGGLWQGARPFSEAVRRLAGPLSLGVIGVGAAQINALLDIFFARQTDLAGPAYLWYAIRCQQVPLALIGIALSGTSLPAIARSIQNGNYDKARSFLQFALEKAFTLMWPATLVMWVLGYSGIDALFRHGAFSDDAVIQSLRCLWGYAIGLVPQTFVLLLSNICYSLGLYRVTTIAALASLVINVVLNAIMVYSFGLGSMSVAIATSISAFANLFILHRYLCNNQPLLKARLWDGQIALEFVFGIICASALAVFNYHFLPDPSYQISQGVFLAPNSGFHPVLKVLLFFSQIAAFGFGFYGLKRASARLFGERVPHPV